MAAPSSSSSSSSSPIPRPPSRSERLLRDTLRKDDTLRTHGAARPRSNSSNCDDDDGDDDNIFQSAILFRCSSGRNGTHPSGYYLPDHDEHASYSRLIRSSSNSGSSRSGRSEPKSPPRHTYAHEKLEEPSRHQDATPHEAVLRSRLDTVMHSMRIDRHTDALDALILAQSSTASLTSSLGSISNAHAHSHESHQTHLTVPDPDPCVPLAAQAERPSHKSHRHAHSASAVHAQPTLPQRTSIPPHSPRSPRASQTPRSPPRTPTSREKEQPKRQHSDSPWMYVPLPPSPPTFSASPSKRAGPAVVTFVASPSTVDAHSHAPMRSHARHSHSPNSASVFDPDAASHALRQLPGYVSFASVAGLGVPPEEEDPRTGRRPLAGLIYGGGKGRIPGLGLGSGKWWIF